MPVKTLPCPSGNEAVTAALKELYAQLLLHLFQILRHSGLRHIEGLGRACEVTPFIDLRKELHLPDRHRSHPPYHEHVL